MEKKWIQRAYALLEHSLNPIPQELNELDWKEDLSPNKEQLARHLSAFSNHPGGGFLAFGIKDHIGELVGITHEQVTAVLKKLCNLCHDSLDPVVKIDHSIELVGGASILFIHIKESAIKPVHIKNKGIEEAYIRSGGTTRKASRQEVGGLMLNSKTPQFEELHCSSLKQMHETLNLLDFRSVCGLLNKPVPQSRDDIIQWLTDEKMIEPIDGAGYYITNFGALASAQNLGDFDSLSRKCIRLIKYDGLNKLKTSKEYPGSKGYAIELTGLLAFIKALLPASEIIKDALDHPTCFDKLS